MAGHSKWANIKHRKSRQDAKRGKEFTKVIREITAAVKMGGDGNDNPRLRQAIEKAIGVNMPRVTVDRAIKRAAGGEETANYQETIYEGYGPGGSAIYIEALTDNKNRSVAEIRHVLSRNGGNLGAEGCAGHLFDRVAVLEVKNASDEDKLLLDALEAGATEMEVAGDEKGHYYLQTNSTDLQKLSDSLAEIGYTLGEREITMLPHTSLTIDDDSLNKLRNLYDDLEDLDDVQNVYCNVTLSD